MKNIPHGPHKLDKLTNQSNKRLQNSNDLRKGYVFFALAGGSQPCLFIVLTGSENVTQTLDLHVN